MNMGTLLIRNVVRDGVPCDIYIKEGVISSIGRGLDPEADTVLDGGGKTVMPAFVNMHTHSGMTLFRGICEDMPLSISTICTGGLTRPPRRWRTAA